MEVKESLENLNKYKRIKSIITSFIESCAPDKCKNHVQYMLNASFSLKEISDVVLKEALRLTESKYCYVAYVDPKNKDSVGISFTKMTSKCDLYKKIGEARFPVRKNGTYGGLLGYSLDTGESFYIQDVKTHEDAHGIPDGHAPVKQFLSVPVFSGDKITGQIVLGSLKKEYTYKDIEITEKIADFYGMVLGKLL